MRAAYFMAAVGLAVGASAQANVDVSQAGQPEYAQCGGRTYSGPSQCDSGLECIFVSDTYYQCLRAGEAPAQQNPQPTSAGRQTTFVTVPAPAPTTAADPNPGAYQQCGGAGYTGSRQCQPGFQCVAIDQYYSLCEVHSVTVTQTIIVTVPVAGPTSTQRPAATAAPPSTGGSAVSPYLDQCAGSLWKGPTRCATGLVCVYLNQYYSQCLYPGQSLIPATTKR